MSRPHTLILLLAALWLCPAPVMAAAAPLPDQQAALLRQYQLFQTRLAGSAFAEPLQIVSSLADGQARGAVYAVLNRPLESLQDYLSRSDHWCEIIFLHLNTKGCIVDHSDARERLLLYVGRKHYQRPEQAFLLHYRFVAEHSGRDYLQVSLRAEQGRFGTSDHQISLRAIRLDDARSFLAFSYSYRFGFAARLAMEGYLATLGRDKVGFSASVAGDDDPYVGGLQGAVERNAMRYYLALRACLDTVTHGKATEQGLLTRLQRWFELTERYPRQLHEVERHAYLAMKQKEYRYLRLNGDAILAASR